MTQGYHVFLVYTYLMVEDYAVARVQCRSLFGMRYRPKEMAVPLRATVLPIMRQAQPHKTLFSRHSLLMLQHENMPTYTQESPRWDYASLITALSQLHLVGT